MNSLWTEHTRHVAHEVAVQSIVFEVFEVKRMAIPLVVEIDVDPLAKQVHVHDGCGPMSLQEFYGIEGEVLG
jgi:hypothetical protein